MKGLNNFFKALDKNIRKMNKKIKFLQPLRGYIMNSFVRANIRLSSFQHEHLWHVFFLKYKCYVASYGHDNISRTSHLDFCSLNCVLSKLQNCADSLFTWFKDNHMKPNGDKCHLFLTTEKSVNVKNDGSNVKWTKTTRHKFWIIKVLIKAFITFQFSYCPLIWMLHSRTINNRINNIYERALKLIHEDNQSSFKELL